MMRNKILTISLLGLTALWAISCDAPRDRRAAFRDKTSLNSFPTFSGFSVDGPPSTGTPTTAGSGSGASGTTGSGSGSSAIPAEVAHCSWSTDGISGYASNHATIGPYTLCKSNSSETNVFIQVKNPITDSYLCMVPTTHNNSLSTYVGEPRCVMATNAKTIYKITFLKNRTGYSGYSITGAMIMRDKNEWFPSPYFQYLLVPDAYLFCAEYLAQTGDSSYCYTFNTVGKFVYHQF
ncbi:MAG: hypothetical protein A2X86_01550 [Bdellovibrionales bacterium GWA2_49_15]|nr:MAG: hypothetical protein A2X86_01550 [Bdellovibrionales bacterium GWA2_49_15]